MDDMFRSCSRLIKGPDMSNWITSSLEDISGMFTRCSAMIDPPDVTGWDTSNLENVYQMFWDCSSLTSAPNIADWDVSKIRSFSYFFRDCSSIVTPPDFSSWNTASLEQINYMFAGCTSMTLVAISDWDISKVNRAENFMLGTSGLLDTPSYDLVLEKWGNQEVQANVIIDFGNVSYTPGGAAEAGRDKLIARNWTINDNGPV